MSHPYSPNRHYHQQTDLPRPPRRHPPQTHPSNPYASHLPITPPRLLGIQPPSGLSEALGLPQLQPFPQTQCLSTGPAAPDFSDGATSQQIPFASQQFDHANYPTLLPMHQQAHWGLHDLGHIPTNHPDTGSANVYTDPQTFWNDAWRTYNTTNNDNQYTPAPTQHYPNHFHEDHHHQPHYFSHLNTYTAPSLANPYSNIPQPQQHNAVITTPHQQHHNHPYSSPLASDPSFLPTSTPQQNTPAPLPTNPKPKGLTGKFTEQARRAQAATRKPQPKDKPVAYGNQALPTERGSGRYAEPSRHVNQDPSTSASQSAQQNVHNDSRSVAAAEEDAKAIDCLSPKERQSRFEQVTHQSAEFIEVESPTAKGLDRNGNALERRWKTQSMTLSDYDVKDNPISAASDVIGLSESVNLQTRFAPIVTERGARSSDAFHTASNATTSILVVDLERHDGKTSVGKHTGTLQTSPSRSPNSTEATTPRSADVPTGIYIDTNGEEAKVQSAPTDGNPNTAEQVRREREYSGASPEKPTVFDLTEPKTPGMSPYMTLRRTSLRRPRPNSEVTNAESTCKDDFRKGMTSLRDSRGTTPRSRTREEVPDDVPLGARDAPGVLRNQLKDLSAMDLTYAPPPKLVSRRKVPEINFDSNDDEPAASFLQKEKTQPPLGKARKGRRSASASSKERDSKRAKTTTTSRRISTRRRAGMHESSCHDGGIDEEGSGTTIRDHRSGGGTRVRPKTKAGDYRGGLGEGGKSPKKRERSVFDDDDSADDGHGVEERGNEDNSDDDFMQHVNTAATRTSVYDEVERAPNAKRRKSTPLGSQTRGAAAPKRSSPRSKKSPARGRRGNRDRECIESPAKDVEVKDSDDDETDGDAFSPSQGGSQPMSIVVESIVVKKRKPTQYPEHLWTRMTSDELSTVRRGFVKYYPTPPSNMHAQGRFEQQYMREMPKAMAEALWKNELKPWSDRWWKFFVMFGDFAREKKKQKPYGKNPTLKQPEVDRWAKEFHAKHGDARLPPKSAPTSDNPIAKPLDVSLGDD